MAVGAIFAVAGAIVLAKAGYVQVVDSAATMGQGTLVLQADGARRYQYNPRFQEVILCNRSPPVRLPDGVSLS